MADLIAILGVFMLAIFVGWEVISKVPPILHTPLMSGSNAISGITLIGAIIVSGTDFSLFSIILGCLAVVFAMINAAGGFLITHRMLMKFGKKRVTIPEIIAILVVPAVLTVVLSMLFTASSTLIDLLYLLSAALFILAFKGLQQPRTAERGNIYGASGMTISIIVTLLNFHILGYGTIILGIIIGTVISIVLAIKTQMTQMPQLVGLLNGLGGGASIIVAGASVFATMDIVTGVATVASGIIGAITFFGSLIAFAKLQGLMSEKPLIFKGGHVVNLLLVIVALGLGAWLVIDPTVPGLYWIIVAVSAVLGVLLITPIGGADMPVVISLLNSYSGLAAAATGFVLNNSLLIISGSLVGASGIILTQIMCKAMNRSFTNVLFGGFGATVQ
jgi:hypothetical protein